MKSQVSPNTSQILYLFLFVIIGIIFSACDSAGPGTSEDAPANDPEYTPTAIVVSPSDVTIEEGDTQQFAAEVKDEQGNTLDGVAVEWESSNETIATINSEGLAAGITEGTTNIVASTGDLSGSANLEVEESEQEKSWHEIGGGLFGSEVNAITFDPNGDLIAGGQFLRTRGLNPVRLNSIARWNGSSWKAIDIGLNGMIHALTIDGDGDLIAGGLISETADGSVALNNITRWNGTSWEGIGRGFDFQVRALTVDRDGALIAGGSFNETADDSVTGFNGVARWNGVSWERLGNGLEFSVDGRMRPVTVRSLIVDADGDLIAAGAISIRRSNDIGFVARWNGTSWEVIGNLLTGGDVGGVYVLTLDAEGNIIAGGDFTETETNATRLNHIARWNGSSWEPIGDGFDNRVIALTIDSGGNLIAGGGFSGSPGGAVSYDQVARWDGTAWEGIGDGISYDGSVHCLVVDSNGDLIAGGRIGKGSSLSLIARWGVPD